MARRGRPRRHRPRRTSPVRVRYRQARGGAALRCTRRCRGKSADVPSIALVAGPSTIDRMSGLPKVNARPLLRRSGRSHQTACGCGPPSPTPHHTLECRSAAGNRRHTCPAAAGGGFGLVRRATQPTDARAPPRPQRHGALHRARRRRYDTPRPAAFGDHELVEALRNGFWQRRKRHRRACEWRSGRVGNRYRNPGSV